MSGKSLGFRHNIDSVRWYRGMSDVQMKACDELLHALRDDMEQGSTYRVRHCITQMGIYPPVGAAQIKDIIAMSQGSDLAFLWFLWEFAYKSPPKCGNSDSEHFTVNEQLLLSGIAHLDMPSTLRALDALLPPATQSKKLNSQVKTEPSSSIKKRPKPKNYDLPYFAPLVRPREYIPKSKYRPPETKLLFPEYSHYIDRMKKIPNEASRWFAQYQLCPAKRVVNKLLRDQLNRISLKWDDSLKDKDPVCETHRFWKKVEDLQKQEKILKQPCVTMLDVVGDEVKARRKHILNDIENNVKCATNRMNRQLGITSGSVKHANGSCTARKKKETTMLLRLGNEENPRVHSYAHSLNNSIRVMLMKGNKSHRCGAGDCKVLDVDCEMKGSAEINMKPENSKSLIEEKPSLPTSSFKKLADLIPVCSRTLRSLKRSPPKAPAEESFTNKSIGGFQLDYHKIFDIPSTPAEPLPWEDEVLDLGDKKPVIERFCIDALGNGDNKSKKEMHGHKSNPVVSKAAANCAVNMFRSKVAENAENQDDKHTKQNGDKLIDPDDDEQIESLLKEALRVLRGNRKYVLATLSNAHKMPVLLDWVADRYGKSYCRAGMNSIVKTSFRIYEKVYEKERRNKRNMLELKRSVTGLGSSISYASHKKFMSQVVQRKAEYNNKLNELALEQSRLTWLALRGYSHLGGSIKDTFFAYMPARPQDIKRQHIWKSYHFLDMVNFRLRNRRIHV
ncbi:uncharacterized protein LOC6731725 [Drosophila simulans]|uniref:GD23650 n=1 Tax=Drosophila simulans TaxID=7240 RepID=B4Q8C3_DROSI|nr:uncharacterized protein LOC6731725 [Drosophila simulans]EDX04445.1 GD23650 [Drosophila simulans]KMY89391.1 uncharacterized protein Dsimw501_GD23650 [Drosophila simulans]